MFSGEEDNQEDSNEYHQDDEEDNAMSVSSVASSDQPNSSGSGEGQEEPDDEDDEEGEDEEGEEDENENEHEQMDEDDEEEEEEEEEGEEEEEEEEEDREMEESASTDPDDEEEDQEINEHVPSSQSHQSSHLTSTQAHHQTQPSNEDPRDPSQALLSSSQTLQQTSSTHLDQSYSALVARRRQIVTAPRKFLKPPVIEPLIFIPHGAPVHALALPPCGSHLFSGGQDGFIRRIAIYESVTGSTAENLTMKQGGHVPLIEKEVNKTTIFLTGYWENEDDENAVQMVRKVGGDHSTVKQSNRWGPKSVGNASKVSPVYSLVVQSEELWGLSGTESGNINLFTIRHDEGQIRHVFKSVDTASGPITSSSDIAGHKFGSVVSSLELNHDQTVAFSGGWDGNVLGWDLNTGQVVNRFNAHASQISSVALRPELTGGSIYDSKSADEEFLNHRPSSPKPEAEEEPYHPREEPTEPEPMDQSHSSPAKPSLEYPLESSPDKPMVLDDDDGTDPDGSLFGGSGSEAPGSSDGSIPSPPAAMTSDVPISHPRTPATALSLPTGPDLSRTRLTPASSECFSGLTLPTAAPKTLALPSGAAPLRPVAAPVPLPLLPSRLAQVPSVLDRSLPLLNEDVLMTSGIDGQVYLWDRRIQPTDGRGLVRKLDLSKNTSPWTTSATWGLDGHTVFVGRRNHSVDVYDLRFLQRKTSGLQRSIRLPFSSGPVSCVRMWPDGKSLVCASFDNVRMWNLKAEADGAKIPFRIVPGNSSGVVSSMCVTPSERYLITASGDRGWENISNESVVIHEVRSVI